ncbi:MAG: methionine adenosyltransferase [Desulfuromusa sp.]|jgi:S-adenosylmethionine synthetase|nr:methionine adenosyltransferase [Desulfuromusa sp.]
MSRLNANHIFTSESVSEGHPDKVCDLISDAIVDACLAKDANSRVACETLVTTDFVMTAGEITCQGFESLDTEAIARKVVRDIGYDRKDYLFCADTFEYQTRLHGQSPDIAQGVNEGTGIDTDQGAGDQGMMFGYASNATPELMPAPIVYSHRLLSRLAEARKEGKIDYLRPDSKAQVSVMHKDGRPDHITSVVISQQTDDISTDQIKQDLIAFIKDVLEPTGMLRATTDYYINPTGKFVIGGPHGDAGVTGRKIIVDTYGGVGCHGGGAFSGKDPSKVDRSAAYYSRYAAKNIVAAGLAERCEIQVAYAIGVSKPLSINVQTLGTGVRDDAEIQAILESDEIFDFRPAALIRELGLCTPNGWSYHQSAAYGHFGDERFPWERTDKIEALHKAANL